MMSRDFLIIDDPLYIGLVGSVPESREHLIYRPDHFSRCLLHIIGKELTVRAGICSELFLI